MTTGFWWKNSSPASKLPAASWATTISRPCRLVEIVPSDSFPFFNYEAKYQPGATAEIVPARLSPEMTSRVQECGLQAHRALGCRGYSRTDTLIRDNDIYVLETNTIPGMTATSLFPQAAAAAGLEFPTLLDRLVELALEK